MAVHISMLRCRGACRISVLAACHFGRGVNHYLTPLLRNRTSDGTTAGPACPPGEKEMCFNAPYHTEPPHQDDKQARICEFIRQYLTAGGDCPRTVLVVARSAQSPVLQALHAVVRDGVVPGVEARIVIADDDAGPVAGDGGELACDVRIANNPRLLDAHRSEEHTSEL